MSPTSTCRLLPYGRIEFSILSMVAAAPCGGGDPERAIVRRPDATAGERLDCHLLYTSVKGAFNR